MNRISKESGNHPYLPDTPIKLFILFYMGVALFAHMPCHHDMIKPLWEAILRALKVIIGGQGQLNWTD